ncbi:MAG: L,D-transpeptidase [Cyanobacteria bacterium RM1_2_2]|nr:L,D-transpeptidase [Cyanobacteria bacterium RM1_2_2]
MRRALKVCLGLVFLCGWSQRSLAAQPSEPPQQATRAVGTIESRIRPPLPPIQPILPEAKSIRLVLKLQERRLYVYNGERIQASYPVAVGKSGWETPEGEFRVLEMVRQPGWTNPFTQEVMPPGPENPLGERWIAFWTDGTNYVGFHGTPNRASVGQFASHGCVRMFNEHVRALYEVVQIGTQVVVEP